jgi:hypothetical protein
MELCTHLARHFDVIVVVVFIYRVKNIPLLTRSDKEKDDLKAQIYTQQVALGIEERGEQEKGVCVG